jgi:hypothetical protein
MARNWLIGVALTAAACLLAGGGPTTGKGGRAAVKPPEEGPFAGKFLLVGASNPSANGNAKPPEYYALEGGQVKRLGDRYFLVGKVLPSEQATRWDKGVVLWLPLANITEMAEYKTQDAVRKAYVTVIGGPP